MSQSESPIKHLDLARDTDIIISEARIDQAIQQIARELNSYFSQPRFEESPVMAYCVMNGGLYFSGQLLRYLDFPLQVSYLHASRYGNHTHGAELQWKARPSEERIQHQHILLLDDIFDEGLTLEAIDAECRALDAQSIHSAVLVDKRHTRKPNSGFKPDFIGLEVEDRYIFGCGMDYKGLWRNLPAIHALKL